MQMERGAVSDILQRWRAAERLRDGCRIGSSGWVEATSMIDALQDELRVVASTPTTGHARAVDRDANDPVEPAEGRDGRALGKP